MLIIRGTEMLIFYIPCHLMVAQLSCDLELPLIPDVEAGNFMLP